MTHFRGSPANRAALVAFSLVLLACTPGPAPRPPDVLLICLDTVRADHLGCYGYERRPTTPHLDALARESVLFADASAAACWTKPSVPSFLTGTWPLEHGVYEGSARANEGETTDLLPENAHTLAEAFAEAGYATAAFVHNAQLRRGNGFEQGFERYDEGNFDAREIRWRAKDWLDERTAEQPFFLYLHFLDAHFPCPVPDEYAGMFAEGADLSLFRGDEWKALREDVNDGRRTLSSAEREALVALYDGAIRYIDDELGRLFAALERDGSSQDLIICVIADHGEEFLEHGRIGHGHGLYETLLHVPWLMRIPDRKAARVEEPVTLVDLHPTLLAAAGVRAAMRTAGVDRLSGATDPTPLFAEHKEPGGYVQSLREGRWKLVRRFLPAPADAGPESDFELPPVGTRWEVEVVVNSDGTLRAEKLAKRSEPSTDPLEIKARIEHREPSRMSLCGIEIRVEPTTELYGEVPVREGKTLGWEDGVAADGTLVKAIGRFADGGFVCQRIKLYGAGEEAEQEIRGSIEAADGQRESGRLRIGDVWIEWDAETNWSTETRSAALSREDVARIAELGAGPAEELGLRVETRLFDLAGDPGEQAPIEDPSRAAQMSATLDAFTRELFPRRIWSDADRAILESEALEELRHLGYVR